MQEFYKTRNRPIFKRIISFGVPTFALFALCGCEKNNGASQTQFGTTTPEASAQEATQAEAGILGPEQQAYQKAKDAALDESDKEYEARVHAASAPTSQFRFPNTFDPEQPIPNYLNFYGINERRPHYLLCEYRVDINDYNPSKEAAWFKASLEQVRQSGPTNFPPVQWIAVIIVNRAGWNGASTFEQAHKVGAIFKASDVFDSSQNLSQLVANAQMDRHPFKYDTSQPTPDDQQRWMIVERHAATNDTASGKPK